MIVLKLPIVSSYGPDKIYWLPSLKKQTDLIVIGGEHYPCALLEMFEHLNFSESDLDLKITNMPNCRKNKITDHKSFDKSKLKCSIQYLKKL